MARFSSHSSPHDRVEPVGITNRVGELPGADLGVSDDDPGPAVLHVGQGGQHIDVETGVQQRPAPLPLLLRRVTLRPAFHEQTESVAGVRFQLGLGDGAFRQIAAGDEVNVDLVVAVNVAGDGAEPHRPLRVDLPSFGRVAPVVGEGLPNRLVARDGEAVFLLG